MTTQTLVTALRARGNRTLADKLARAARHLEANLNDERDEAPDVMPLIRRVRALEDEACTVLEAPQEPRMGKLATKTLRRLLRTAMYHEDAWRAQEADTRLGDHAREMATELADLRDWAQAVRVEALGHTLPTVRLADLLATSPAQLARREAPR